MQGQSAVRSGVLTSELLEKEMRSCKSQDEAAMQGLVGWLDGPIMFFRVDGPIVNYTDSSNGLRASDIAAVGQD